MYTGYIFIYIVTRRSINILYRALDNEAALDRFLESASASWPIETVTVEWGNTTANEFGAADNTLDGSTGHPTCRSNHCEFDMYGIIDANIIYSTARQFSFENAISSLQLVVVRAWPIN